MRHHSTPKPAAFTLVELLAVVTILFILAVVGVAGIGIMGHQTDRQKATLQLAVLADALENYHTDMGEYPATEDSATGLSVTGSSIDVHVSASAGPTKLFNVLFRDGVVNGTRIYCPRLDPANGEGWVSAPDIIDPWGNPYRYRSEHGLGGAAGGSSQNSSTLESGFDLWTSGKDGKSSPGDSGAVMNRDDIRSVPRGPAGAGKSGHHPVASAD